MSRPENVREPPAGLARLRMDAGLTQKELGRRLGVSKQAVCYWENGHSVPRSRLLLRLAEVLGVDVPVLIAIFGGGEPAPAPDKDKDTREEAEKP